MNCVPKVNFMSWDFNGAWVFLRADLNVPLDNGRIVDDYRLQSIVPTLNALLDRGARIILATHIGRPGGQDATYSTRHLMPWFVHHGYRILYVSELARVAHAQVRAQEHDIILFENLRFYAGEREADYDERMVWARQLASCADYYVNDAFGAMASYDSSIILVPQFFPRERRSMGLLVERELTLLGSMFDCPARPFVALLGGAKVHEKIPLIKHLLPKIDTLCLCPPLVFSFLHAQGAKTGVSLVDERMGDACREIIARVRELGVRCMYPVDYLVGLHDINGVSSVVRAEQLSSGSGRDYAGISIGPETVAAYTEIIMSAGLVFYNGLMGFANRPDMLDGFAGIIRAMNMTQAKTCIAGGDSVGAARMLGMAENITLCSTGGGATLAYIAEGTLPVFEALFL